MSDIVRLNLKAGPVKVKLNYDDTSDFDFQADNNKAEEEAYFQSQLQAQYEKGIADGQEAIRYELEKDYTNKLIERTEEFNRILASIEASLSGYEEAFDKIVIEVSIAVAEKIVKHEISRESIINETLRESVRRVLGANEILIKINPQDYKILHSGEQNVQFEDSFSKIKFEQDDKVEAGGCIVETEIGNVDARINTQISEIRKQFEVNFNDQTS
ncbi:MAG: FliH/SctL family protein [Ignavibacteriales bacterium]